MTMSTGSEQLTAAPIAMWDTSDNVINDPLIIIFRWVIYTVVCQAIDIFGIGTNIINIVCFVKQGLNDPVNISLVGLAVSDLGSLVTLLWTNICFTPAFNEADLPFDAIEFQYLTSAMPHATFATVTGWITALITLERCICITAPLKVKMIITPKRVFVIIVVVFVIILSSVAPVYVVNRLDMKYSPTRNKTIIGIISTANKNDIEKISIAISNVFIPVSAFVVLVICTVTLVIQLHIKTKWRNKSSTTARVDNVSNRNQKVAKMVVTISTLFIACYVPVNIMFFGISAVPDLSTEGKHRGLLIIIAGIGIVLESINSSFNIFVYYYMSSRYREAFRQLFCVGRNGSAVSKKDNFKYCKSLPDKDALKTTTM